MSVSKSKNAKADWRKRTTRIIALALVLLLAVAAIIAAAIPVLAEPARTQYELEIDILEDLRAARVTQTVRYQNQTGTALDAVLFVMAANAYRRALTAPVPAGDAAAAYPSGFEAGGASIRSVTVNGAAADWGARGDDEAVLRVECALAPGETAEFGFAYELLLPDCLGALGAMERGMGWRLSGFYPAVAVYGGDARGFLAREVSPIGDNSFADPGDFTVRVTAPETYRLAAPGAVTRAAQADGRALWTIELRGARDLTLALGRKYTLFQRTTPSGTALRAYSNHPVTAGRALDAAARALALYEDWFGPYPFEDLTLAQADLGGQALAGSGILLLDGDWFRVGEGAELEYQIALGLAKQWFGAQVGNDPQDEPWLDEAVSAYSALLYYESSYGEARFQQELDARVLPALQMTIPGGVQVDSGADYFNSFGEYQAVLCGRGAAVLHELRLVMGKEGLLSALRAYVEDNAGQIATRVQFTAAVNGAAGRDLTAFLDETLAGIDQYVDQSMEHYN